MSASVKQQLNFLLEPDNLDTRSNFRKLFEDPIFVPRYNISLVESRNLALQRLQKIVEKKPFSVFDFESNPMNIFAGTEDECNNSS